MVEPVFTLEEVLRWASEISGKGLTSERKSLIDLIRESLDALYAEESVDNLRSFCIQACGCSITIPNEISFAQKYKIGDQVHAVRNKAYDFIGYARVSECASYRTDLTFQGEFPTYYDLPRKGARVAARSLEPFRCELHPDKKPYLLVQGKDLYGKQVFTKVHSEMDVGERVYISQPSENPEYSDTIFSSIDSVRIVNGKLNIQFIWCNVAEKGMTPSEYGLLAVYNPSEQFPGFQRFKLPGLDKSCCYNIEILGYLRKPPLVYDNELIRGFESIAIRSMLRANYYRSTNDINGATFNSNIAVSGIRKHNERLSENTDAIAPFVPTSAAKFPRVN